MSTQNDIMTLTDRLRGLRRYILISRVTGGSLLAVSALLGLLLTATLLHGSMGMPVWLRSAYALAGILVLAWTSYRHIISPLLFAPSLEDVSLVVEKRFPHLENRLIASLQLESNLRENRENFSTDMIRALIAQTSQTVEGLDLRTSHSNRSVRKFARLFAVVAVAVVGLAIIAPSMFWTSMHALSHPLTEIEAPTTFSLTVIPGATEVLKYDPLEVSVTVAGAKLPEIAEILWNDSDDESEWRSEEMSKTATEAFGTSVRAGLLGAADSMRFTYRFPEVKHDFRYYVAAGRVESEEYAITVVDKPRITDIKQTYIYPGYTGLKSAVVDENDGNIQALVGTKVKIEFTSNKEIANGELVYSDGDREPLSCDGNQSSVTMQVSGDKSYHASVTDVYGYINPDPIEYRITALEDAYPELYMLSPSGNVDLDDYMTVGIKANIADDFGFTKLVLRYTMHQSETEQWDQTETIGLASNSREQQVEYSWDLSNAGMVPGSWAEYHLELFDNDVVSGPKVTIGPILAVRLPSLDELFAQIESSREDQLEQYSESLKRQKEIQEEFERISREIKQQKDLDWEQLKDAEAAAAKQQNLVEQFDSLARQFEETNQKALDNQLLTMEMMQKLTELQKLFDEVATQEMKDALKRLQEALSQMNKEEIERAMENFEMKMEDVMKNIERAIAQLKKMQVEQKMADMIRQAEELLKNQQGVNDLTDKSSDNELPKAAPKEKNVQSSLENLKSDTDDLQKMLKEAGIEQNQDAQNFCAAPKESGAEQDITQMTSDLEQSNRKSAQKSGSSAGSKLANMLQKMKDSKSAMSMEMSEELAQKMRKALDDTFYLSDKQEEFLGTVQRKASDPSDIRELAEEQQKLQSHAEWLDSYLLELSKESVFMQRQIDKLMAQCKAQMGSAKSSLSEMKAPMAMEAQRDAIFSLNQTSKMIMESLNNQNQCNSSCSNPSPSMCNKMNQMCQKQSEVNMKTESMCNNPNKMGPGNKEAMERLASEQAAVRKSMQELANEVADKKQIQGRLQNFAEDMQKVVETLEKGSVGDETIERQRKIYQRMLDFQLSMERQDYNEMRQAERAEQMLRRGPAPLDDAARAGSESYEKRLQKFLEEGYPPEYETLIKDYFRAVMEANQQ
jgi:hypothetical protein